MNIYTSEQVHPYVYMCIHRVTGHFYIGSRTAKDITYSHLDLPKYKTSSPKVHPIFDEYDWFILAHFVNKDTAADDAYDFEQETIYLTWDDPLSLNESCYYGKHRFRLSGPRTQAHKDAIGRAHKGKTITPDHIARAVATRRSNSGWAITEETRAKLVKAHTGMKHSEESKQKMRKPKAPFSEEHKKKLSAASLAQTNNKFRKKQEIVGCPYCGKQGGELTMPRWHFDRCKAKP